MLKVTSLFLTRKPLTPMMASRRHRSSDHQSRRFTNQSAQATDFALTHQVQEKLMTLKIVAAIAAFAVLSGCAWQTPALKLDNQLYQTSANASLARGAQTGARRLALEAANAKCTSLGSDISVLDIQSRWSFPVNGVAFVTFRCKPVASHKVG
jgi:hypothetical protein